MMWRLALGVHRRQGARKLLSALGLFMLISVVLAWLVWLWIGWTLIFSADPGAVVNAKTGTPAGFWERVYFAGFTVFTLGTGDYNPVGSLFQVLTPISTLTGLFVATLSVTYLLPIVSAGVDSRSLALAIKGLGETPEGIVRRTWDGNGFPDLEKLLITVSGQLTRHGQRHLAYPILHFYAAGDRSDVATAVRICALDEALTLFLYGVAVEARPSPAVLQTTRSAVTSYLDTLKAMYIEPASEAPPTFDLGNLRASGIPTEEFDEFERLLEKEEDRRRLLLGNIEFSGWTWDAVVHTSTSKI